MVNDDIFLRQLNAFFEGLLRRAGLGEAVMEEAEVGAEAQGAPPPPASHELPLIARHLVARGQLERLEDLLFGALEAGVEGAGPLARETLEGLLGWEDEALARGGLPRDEVEAALADLRSLQDALYR